MNLAFSVNSWSVSVETTAATLLAQGQLGLLAGLMVSVGKWDPLRAARLYLMKLWQLRAKRGSVAAQMSISSTPATFPVAHSKRKQSQKTTTGHMADRNDPGEPSPNRYICVTASASVTQGTWWKKGQKDCKRQNSRKSTEKQSLLETAA